MLGVMKSSSNMLIYFINDIIDLFKIKQGIFVKQIATFDPRDLFEQMISIIKRACDEKNIKLSSFFYDRVPNKITGDKQRLLQVLHNLLQNAIKFTIKGKIQVIVDYDN